MKKLLTICLMLLGAVAQAQNFAITATTESAIRKNIVKGNAANYGFGMINDTLKLVGLTTRNVIFTGSTSKTDIGLGNVDNTSDLNKPVSTATQTALNLKQNQLNGTGFVKASGTTISYDNSTYLSTSSASSTYLPISNPTSTGTLTAPTIANSLGANFATTSGNVGIGTTNPTSKLQVNGNVLIESASGAELRINNTSDAGRAGYFSVTGDGDFSNRFVNIGSSSTAYGFRMLNGAGTHLTILNGGNVGIGTTSPAAKLHVYSTAAFNRMQVENTGNFQNGLRLNRTGGDYATDWEIYTPSNSTALNFFNGANRMTMFANGRVGINTTTDAGYLLDVNGTSIVRGTARFQSLSQAGYSELSSNSTGAIYQTNGHAYFYTNANAYDVYFQKYNSTGTNMIIKDSGNIGIGTGTPNASSILDITSTTKGVLLPRMTTTEISAIASPADGLTVYNTTLKVICFYDSSAAVWKKVSHSNM